MDHANWLRQKEIKAFKINQHIDAHNVTVVTMRLNIPGPEKKPEWSDLLFQKSVNVLKQNLTELGFTFENILESITEDYFEHLLILAVCGSAQAIKKQMIYLENTSDIGRILDIDVIDTDGRCLNRSDFDMAQRQCYLCNEVANVCRRAQRHSNEALTEYLIVKAKGLLDN